MQTLYQDPEELAMFSWSDALRIETRPWNALCNGVSLLTHWLARDQ